MTDKICDKQPDIFVYIYRQICKNQTIILRIFQHLNFHNLASQLRGEFAYLIIMLFFYSEFNLNCAISEFNQICYIYLLIPIQIYIVGLNFLPYNTSHTPNTPSNVPSWEHRLPRGRNSQTVGYRNPPSPPLGIFGDIYFLKLYYIRNSNPQ